MAQQFNLLFQTLPGSSQKRRRTIALLQQVLGPAFALDQNQITLDTASNGARNAQIAYQAVAPSGAADPQVLTDPAKLRDWAAAAEQVAVAFDDLVTRLKERADLLSRSQ